jgi:hypothetical protein
VQLEGMLEREGNGAATAMSARWWWPAVHKVKKKTKKNKTNK